MQCCLSTNKNRRTFLKTIITEEMRFRQRVVEYAIKYNNNAKVAEDTIPAVNKYGVEKKYDGTSNL